MMSFRVISSLAGRELRSQFLSPVGYVLAALFVFLSGLLFYVVAPILLATGFAEGQPASMRLFFLLGLWVFLFIGPAVSMRSLADEFRQGTFELLMTSPIRPIEIVLGKFAGLMGFMLLILLPTVVFVVSLELHGRPDYGEVLSGYLGLLLVAAAMLSSGMLASSLTQSQLLAFAGTLSFWLILVLVTAAMPFLAGLAEASAASLEGHADAAGILEWLASAARFISHGNPAVRMAGFVNGLVDTFGVVYFVAAVAFFLLATVVSINLRREL